MRVTNLCEMEDLASFALMAAKAFNTAKKNGDAAHIFTLGGIECGGLCATREGVDGILVFRVDSKFEPVLFEHATI